MPENEDVVSKRAQRRAVGRHRVVSEIAGDNLRKPFPGFRNWPVHSMPQPLLDLPSFAHMRSRRDFLLIRKSPRRDLSQMSTKPRNLKVSGLERPRLLQFCAAKRPNSIRRVFSGGSDSENSRSLSRIASRKRRASLSCWKPTTVSSAYLT